jgi:MYXO-CTERM domain-containing protein
VNPAAQYVDVVAMYGGDASHQASTSAKVRISFTTTASFCLVPSTASIQPCDGFTFSFTGGTAPLTWYDVGDSTCDNYGNCSTLNSTTGAFVAGPTNGYVVIAAIDANGFEQFAYLTVGDVADAGPPIWGDAQAPLGGCSATMPSGGIVLSVTGACAPPDASGPPIDSGSSMSLTDGAVSEDDAGMAPVDAGNDAPAVSDAAADAGSSGGSAKSGCGCKVVAGGSDAPAGALAGLGLGLGTLIRRRRQGRPSTPLTGPHAR